MPDRKEEDSGRQRVAVVRFAPDGKILSADMRACELFGYAADELSGLSYSDIDPRWAAEGRKACFGELAAGGASKFNRYLRRKDGVLFPASVICHRAGPLDDGTVVAFIDDVSTDVWKEESLRRTQFVLDNAREGVFWTLEDGSIIYVNEAACRFLGYGRDELLRMTVADFDPSVTPENYPYYWGVTREQGPRFFETTHKAKDGRVFPVEISVTIVNFGGKEIHCTFVRDISGRKRAEEALRESEERLRLALKAANQGLYDADFRTGEVTVSPEYASMLGYDPETFRLTVDSWTEMLHPEDRDTVIGKFRAYCRGDAEAYSLVFRQRTRSGAYRWIYSTGKIVAWDEEGKPVRMVGTHTDITARKEIEEALRDSEYFLRRSQEVARLGSYKLDIPSGTWDSSPVLDEIFGIDGRYPKDVAGWTGLIAPEQRGEMRDYLERHVVGGRNRFDKEYRIVRRSDGAQRWVHGLGELEFDERGAPVRMIGTIQDVTERKAAEREREEIEEALRQSQKLETVGRLAGGVAHEFNNLLSIILGYADLARSRTPEGDPVRKYADEIEKAGGRARDITAQLLAFSRRQILAPKAVNLNDLIAAMARTLGKVIGDGIRVDFLPGEGLWNVLVDPARMDQILLNLAVNARDAMPDGGRLTIATANARLGERCGGKDFSMASGDFVRVTVSDEGAGMDRETLSHIFEPFFSTKGIGKGTGLGLPTVYGIVKQSGGFIEADSEPGKGTVFRVYFPRLAEEGVAPEGSAPGGEDAAEPAVRSVLLVEDDEMVRRLMLRQFAGLGYEVVCAGSPHEALDMFGDPGFSVDLLVTDVMMPGMKGAELWKKVRSLRPGAKVLFISGYTAEEMADRGIIEKDAPFLKKPFTRAELARAMADAVSRGRGGAPYGGKGSL
jgi:PAS domain S-box-containing protein